MQTNVFERFEKNNNFYSKSEERLIKRWFKDLNDHDNLSEIFRVRGELLSLGQIKVIGSCFPNLPAKMIRVNFEKNSWITDLIESRTERNNLWTLANSISNILTEDEKQKINDLSIEKANNNEDYQANVACVRRLPMSNLPHFDSFLNSTKGLEGSDIPGAKIYVFDKENNELIESIDMDEKETAITLNRAKEILEKIKNNKDEYISKYEAENDIKIDEKDKNKIFHQEIKPYFYSKILQRKLYQFAIQKTGADYKFLNVDVEGFFRQKFSVGLNQKQQETLKDESKLRDFFRRELGEISGSNGTSLESVVSDNNQVFEVTIGDDELQYFKPKKRNENGHNGDNGNKKRKISERRALSFAMERARQSGKPWSYELCKKYIDLEVKNNPMVLEHYISLHQLHENGLLDKVRKVLSLAAGPHEEYRCYSYLAKKKNIEVPMFTNVDFSPEMLNMSRKEMAEGELGQNLSKCVDIARSVKEWPIEGKFDLIECSSWDSIFKYDKSKDENIRKFFGNIFSSLNNQGILKFALDKKLSREFIELLQQSGFNIFIANRRFNLANKEMDKKMSGRRHFWLIAQIKPGVDLNAAEMVRKMTDINIFAQYDVIDENSDVVIDDNNVIQDDIDRNYGENNSDKDIPVFMAIVENPTKYLSKEGFEEKFLLRALEKVVGQVDIKMAREIYQKYILDKNLHKFLPVVLDIIESTGRSERIINLDILNVADDQVTTRAWKLIVENPLEYMDDIFESSLETDMIEGFLNKIDWSQEKYIAKLEKIFGRQFNNESFQKHISTIFAVLPKDMILALPVEMRFGKFGKYYFEHSAEKPKDKDSFSINELTSIMERCDLKQKLQVLETVITSLESKFDLTLMSGLMRFLLDKKTTVKNILAPNWNRIANLMHNYMNSAKLGVDEEEKVWALLSEFESDSEKQREYTEKYADMQYKRIVGWITDRFTKRGKKINQNEIKNYLQNEVLVYDKNGQMIGRNDKLINWIVTNVKSSTYAESAMSKSQKINNAILDTLFENFTSIEQKEKIIRNKEYVSNCNGEYIYAIWLAKVVAWADKDNDQNSINKNIQDICRFLYHKKTNTYNGVYHYNSERFCDFIKDLIAKENYPIGTAAKIFADKNFARKLDAMEKMDLILKFPEILHNQDAAQIFAKNKYLDYYNFDNKFNKFTKEKYTPEEIKLIGQYHRQIADIILAKEKFDKDMPMEQKIDLAINLLRLGISGEGLDSLLGSIPKEEKTDKIFDGYFLAKAKPEVLMSEIERLSTKNNFAELIGTLDDNRLLMVANKIDELEDNKRKEVAQMCLERKILSDITIYNFVQKGYLNIEDEKILDELLISPHSDIKNMISGWLNTEEKLNILVDKAKHGNYAADILIMNLQKTNSNHQAEIADKLADKNLLYVNNYDQLLNSGVISLDDEKHLKKAFIYNLDSWLDKWIDSPEKIIVSLKHVADSREAELLLRKTDEYDVCLKPEVTKQLLKKGVMSSVLMREVIKNNISLLDDEQIRLIAYQNNTHEELVEWTEGEPKKVRTIIKLFYGNSEDKLCDSMNEVLSDANKVIEFLGGKRKLGGWHDTIPAKLTHKIIKENIKHPNQVRMLLESGVANAIDLAIEQIDLLPKEEKNNYLQKLLAESKDRKIINAAIKNQPDILKKDDKILELACRNYIPFGTSEQKQNDPLWLFAKENVTNCVRLINTGGNISPRVIEDIILDDWNSWNKANQEILFKELTIKFARSGEFNDQLAKILAENPDWLKHDCVYQYMVRNRYTTTIKNAIEEKNTIFCDSLKNWEITYKYNSVKNRYIYHVKHKDNRQAYIHLFNGSEEIYRMSEEKKDDFEITLEKFNTKDGCWPVAKVKYKQERAGAEVDIKGLYWRRDQYNNNQIIGIEVEFPVKGFISLKNIPYKTRCLLGLENNSLVSKMKKWIAQENASDGVDPEDMEENLNSFIKKARLIRKNGGGSWIMEVVE